MDEYRLFLRGEIDLTSADTVLETLRAQAAIRTGPLIVDCMDIEFIDAAGLKSLVIADNELRRQQRRLLVINAMPMLTRLLDICNLSHLLATPATNDATELAESTEA